MCVYRLAMLLPAMFPHAQFILSYRSTLTALETVGVHPQLGDLCLYDRWSDELAWTLRHAAVLLTYGFGGLDAIFSLHLMLSFQMCRDPVWPYCVSTILAYHHPPLI